ncbi:hypothetical protein [Nocardiopsis halotolerans]|uniref:hypothetical protein n=1 Tax=Nocardiopsis halotolerans TaxID=124252 RepID=UPI00034AE614|nr:hypothetical protein [Nocardiopsis halotolerans]
MPRRLVTPGRRWRGRLCALLLTAAVLLCTAPAAAGPVVPGDGAAAVSSGTEGRRDGPVVLVGIPGLLWQDVNPETTPTLWKMAERGSVGNVSIRTATSRTCPTDGWLSVSAGQRALSIRERFTVCEAAPWPERTGSGAVVPGFDAYVHQNARSPFGAPVGLLGQTVREAGGTTLAVGPGAALGVADSSGRVDHYVDGVRDLTTERLEGISLAAVELAGLTRLYPDYPDPPITDEEAREAAQAPPGEFAEVDEEGEEARRPPEPDPEDVPEWERDNALANLDARLRTLEGVLPVGSSLMVVGVSMDTGPSQLTMALSGGITEEGFTGEEAFLASDSTRRAGLVVLTDTTPTVLTALGMRATEPTSGRAWHLTERPPTTERAVGRLVEVNTAAVVVGAAIPGFFSGLVVFQVLVYAAAAYALHRYSKKQRGKRARVLTLTRVVALAGAAFPVASYLSNLIPWWASSAPLVSLLVSVLVADALVVALAMAGPWRRTVLGPMTVVAGATTMVLFVDLCTGAHLQLNSPTGYSPIVAGRFYGVGNIGFATFATGMLMTVAGMSHELVTRGWRRTAVVATLVVGASTVLVVGWPGLGTDFGGVIALIPGLAVTTMMIAGVRVTALRLAVVGVVTVTAISLLSWLDYLRPAEDRSHLGAFAAQVVSGEAGAVVARKLSAMLGTLGNWHLTLLAGCALVFLFVMLHRPTHWRIGALQVAYEYAPTLRAGLTGSLVTALVGFAVNDSGVAIPAIALTVAVPLTLSACVWALQQRDEDRTHGPEPVENAQCM